MIDRIKHILNNFMNFRNYLYNFFNTKYTFNLVNNIVVLLELLKKKDLKIGFCESCTGGLISSEFTKLPGVSSVFDRAIITYSNDSKIEELDVNIETLEKYGAVSKEVAIEMARGLFKKANLDITLSVTGIAGPNGGSKNKPVGLVYICIYFNNIAYVYKNYFKGNRIKIQKQTAEKAVELLINILKNVDQTD